MQEALFLVGASPRLLELLEQASFLLSTQREIVEAHFAANKEIFSSLQENLKLIPKPKGLLNRVERLKTLISELATMDQELAQGLASHNQKTKGSRLS